MLISVQTKIYLCFVPHINVQLFTSECWRGPATRYSLLICTIHGSDFGLRKGIESCRWPINPDFTSNGNSRPFKAVFFKGRLWRSTVPRMTKRGYSECLTGRLWSRCQDSFRLFNFVFNYWLKSSQKHPTFG